MSTRSFITIDILSECRFTVQQQHLGVLHYGRFAALMVQGERSEAVYSESFRVYHAYKCFIKLPECLWAAVTEELESSWVKTSSLCLPESSLQKWNWGNLSNGERIKSQMMSSNRLKGEKCSEQEKNNYVRGMRERERNQPATVFQSNGHWDSELLSTDGQPNKQPNTVRKSGD